MNTPTHAIEQTLAGLKPGETAAWHCSAAGELAFLRLGSAPEGHYQISYPASTVDEALAEKPNADEFRPLLRSWDENPIVLTPDIIIAAMRSLVRFEREHGLVGQTA